MVLQFSKEWWPYLAAAVAAVWAIYTYFDKRERDSKLPKAQIPTVKVKADRGSMAVGIMSGGSINNEDDSSSGRGS